VVTRSMWTLLWWKLIVCLQARYDEELKAYLKMTGLRSCDLVKQKPKKSKPSQAQQRRPAAPPAPLPPARPAAAAPAADVHHQQPQQHAQVTANHQQQQQLQVRIITLDTVISENLSLSVPGAPWMLMVHWVLFTDSQCYWCGYNEKTVAFYVTYYLCPPLR